MSALASRLLLVTVGLKIRPLKLRCHPLGVCAPPRLCECALVIPPTESDDVCLEMIVLVSSVMGRKGFLGSDPEYPLEPQMHFLKSCALSGCLLRSERFHRQKLMTGGSKEAPWLALNWVGRNLQDNPLSRAATQNPLSNPCALTG
jgi:hypothetical protein